MADIPEKLRKYIPETDLRPLFDRLTADLTGLQSTDPRVVATTNDGLLQRGYVLTAIPINKLNPDQLTEYLATRAMVAEYSHRAQLAHLLVDLPSRSIDITDLQRMVDDLSLADAEFGTDNFNARLADLARSTKIKFWSTSSAVANPGIVETAIKATRVIISNPDLPEELINRVKVAFIDQAGDTMAELTKLPERPVEKEPLSEKIDSIPQDTRKAEVISLLAKELKDDQVTDRYIDRLVGGINGLALNLRGELAVGTTLHLESARIALAELAKIFQLGSQEKVIGWLGKIGITREDLRVLTASSTFDECATPIIELAKLVGWYDEQEYQNIVTRALGLIMDDHPHGVDIPYHHTTITVYAGFFPHTSERIDNLIETLVAVDISKTDEQVQKAVRVAHGKIGAYDQHAPSTTRDRREFMAILVERGILPPESH